VSLTAAFEAAVGGHRLLPKYFCTCWDFRAFLPGVRRLLFSFSDLYRRGGLLADWISQALRLPILVADAFGFRQCILVVDHLDLADVTLGHCPPFNDEGMNVFVIDGLKEAMSGASFLAACRDTGAVASMLTAIAEESIDLTEGLRVVSTLDVTAPKDGGKEFVVTFEGDEEFQIVLAERHFGGCPAFLRSWKEMNGYADLVDQAAASGGDVDEPRLFLNGIAENVVKQLFVTTDGAPIQMAVRAVTRRDARESVN
jgi:hypothetical protein